MLSYIQKILNDFRGGESFREIYLGILFGFGLGFIPGWSLISVILILAFFITSANGTVWVIMSGIGAALTNVFAGPINALGKLIINNGGTSIASATYDTPALSFLNLHYYNVIGSLLLFIVMAIVLFPLLAKKIVKLSSFLDQKIEKLTLKLPRILQSIVDFFFGERRTKKKALFLKGRIIMLLILSAIVFIPLHIYSNSLAKTSIIETLEAATNKKVDIEDVSISYFTGSITINDLQIYKEGKDRNMLQTSKIKGDISIADILRRRFVIDELNISRLELEQPKQKQENKPQNNNSKSNNNNEDSAFNIGGVNLGNLNSYKNHFTTVKRITKHINDVRSFLGSDNEPKEKVKPTEYKNDKYFAQFCSSCLSKHNRWVIKQANISELFVNKNAPTFFLSAKDISSSPSIYGAKPDIKFDIDEASKAKYKDKLKGKLNNKIEGKVDGLLNKLF